MGQLGAGWWWAQNWAIHKTASFPRRGVTLGDWRDFSDICLTEWYWYLKVSVFCAGPEIHWTFTVRLVEESIEKGLKKTSCWKFFTWGRWSEESLSSLLMQMRCRVLLRSRVRKVNLRSISGSEWLRMVSPSLLLLNKVVIQMRCRKNINFWRKIMGLKNIHTFLTTVSVVSSLCNCSTILLGSRHL